ncbi:MAG: hypothetical protein J5608_00570 [Alphaproteobacteria bacterium]|nr:hypothetical protein [Alphaproteobacteria bacterium]
MTNGIESKLKFAQAGLNVRMKREEEQPVNLVEIFSSRGVDLTGADNL